MARELRCYTIRSGPDKGIHIPGCMGCAVFDHHACTCDGEAGRGGVADYGYPSTDERIEELEDRIAKLESALSTMKSTRG